MNFKKAKKWLLKTKLFRWWRSSSLKKVSGAAGILLLLIAWGAEKYQSNSDAQMVLVREMRGELEFHRRIDSLNDAQQAVAERLYALQAEVHFKFSYTNLTQIQREVRKDIYHSQHLIELYNEYLETIIAKHDWVETFPYRADVIAFVPDQNERNLKYYSKSRGPSESTDLPITNAVSVKDLIYNLRVYNARMFNANLQKFFGDDEKKVLLRKGRELMGTNTLDSMPDADANQLKILLQDYLKKTVARQDEIRNWNTTIIDTINRLIEQREVELYRKAQMGQLAFWIAVITFVLGTLFTIVEKLLEADELPASDNHYR
jgi:hypothetical protein